MPDVGVDTSFYPHPATPAAPADPISSIEKLAFTQNALNQGKMFQMQLDYRNAIGPILQGSIGQDGELDYPKALLGMSKNPATAPFATQFLQEALTRESTQQDIIQKQIKNAIDRNGILGGVGAAIIGEFRDNPGALTQAHVMARLGSDVMATSPEVFGRNTTEQRQRLMQIAASLPPDGKPLYNWAQQYADMAQGAEKTLSQIYGSASTVGTGGEENQLVTSPRMRTSVNVGSLPVTPTPDARNATISTTNPVTGDENPAARQEVAPMFNGRGQVMPGTGVPANALVPGAQPSAPGAPSGLPLAPNAAGPTTPQGGMAPAPAPGAQPQPQRPITKLGDYTQGNFKNLSEYRKNLDTSVETGNRSMALLNGFQNSQQWFETGPGMTWRKEAAQMATSAGMNDLAGKLLHGDPKNAMAAAQAFEMMRVQDALSQLRTTIGPGQRYTNLEFGSVLNSVASLSTDPNAINQVMNIVRNLHALNVWKQQTLANWTTNPDTKGTPIYNAPAAMERALDKFFQAQYATIKPPAGQPLMTRADLFQNLPR